jgi:DNA-binding transcriptional MerR regulator
MSKCESVPLSIGNVAERLGVEPWQVRRVFEKGLLPPASRLGPWRVFAEGDLPRIKAALVERGYLTD